MKISWIVFLFLLLSVDGMAQKKFNPGQIVTFEGKLLNGQILSDSYENLSKRIHFKATNRTDIQQYDPQQIKSFRIADDQMFMAQQVELEPSEATPGAKAKRVWRFLKVLEAGWINVLSYDYGGHTWLYLQKEFAPPVKLFAIRRNVSPFSNKVESDQGQIVSTTINKNITGRFIMEKSYLQSIRQVIAGDNCGVAITSEFPLDEERLRRLMRTVNSCQFNKRKASQASYFTKQFELGVQIQAVRYPFLGNKYDFINVLGAELEMAFINKSNTVTLNFGFARGPEILPDTLQFTEAVKINQYHFRINWYLVPSNKINPYLTGGIKLLAREEEADIATIGRTVLLERSLKINIGLGLRYDINEWLFAKAEINSPYFPEFRAGLGFRLQL